MKKSFITGILLLFFISFTGCLEVKTVVNINKDGSGTVVETVMMSNQVLKMIAGLSNLADDSTRTKPFSIFNEKKLKNKTAEMGEGVEYVSGGPVKTEKMEGYKVVYSFRNLNKLRINENPQNRVPINTMNSLSKSRNEFSRFIFKKGNPSEVLVELPKEKSPKTSSKRKDLIKTGTEQNTEMLKMMQDLHISLYLHVNGKIDNTNAAYVKGNDITLYDIDFNKLMKDKKNLNRLNQLNTQNLEELKQLMKNTPGIKVQLNSPVSVKFE